MEFITAGPIRYHRKGQTPKLVIQSGTHGNEYHLIDTLITVVEELYEELPEFLFVPEISPSAVALKTRLNQYGHDGNRGFGTLQDPEVFWNKELLKQVQHGFGVSFHEDLHSEQFYVYDSGSMTNDVVDSFRQKLVKYNVPLYSGVDDPSDPALAYTIENGYVGQVGYPAEDGCFIEDWAIHFGYLRRFLTFEIPYKHFHVKEILRECLRFAAIQARILP